MPRYHPPIRDILFSLDELHDYSAHLASQDAGDMTFADARIIIEAVGKFAAEILAPLNRVGDQNPAKVVNGRVETPPGFKEAYHQFVEAGWPLLSQPEAYGGMPAPYSLKQVVSEFLQTANHAWGMYAALSDGAIKTLLKSAGEELIETYVPPLVSGEWLATMCLTEPQAGSDLNLVKTRAVANEDGSYNITGNKIFISSGDHDFTGNIVHLVLARLPGAPEGTRGISLFLVPKRLVDDGDKLNDVSCVSVEHKMGLKGSATCQMAFENAKGWLVGAPNRGLQAMFIFINKSRLGVAQQAQGHTQANFQVALEYARERLQGRALHPLSDPDKAADPLILQPDIQRMLMIQKAFAEGGRALIHLCAKWVDLADSRDSEVAAAADKKVALLIPIAKGFLSEVASESTDLAIQVLGGHGYVSEWGIEQRVRDVRVTRIYEGTTGIQAQDLLIRKILGDGGASFGGLLAEMVDAVDTLAKLPDLKALAEALRRGIAVLQSMVDRYLSAGKDNLLKLQAEAVDFLMVTGYVTLGWLWLQSAAVAVDKLSSDDITEADFYREKLHAADFYMKKILPRIYAMEKMAEYTFDEVMPIA